jgi:hypothetical protein
MGAPWFEADPEGFAALREALADRYPALRLDVSDGVATVRGRFPLRDENSRLVDEFEIELVLPHSLTRQLPRLREVGGRVPRDPSRHIYPDGTACLLIEEDFWSQHPEGYTILEFLEGPVRHWLVGQVLYEASGEWPWDEWEHGLKGLLRCYRELFQVNTNEQAIAFLGVLSRKRLKGHWPCPCGSGRRLRDCCVGKVRELHGRLPHRLLKVRWRQLQARGALLSNQKRGSA